MRTLLPSLLAALLLASGSRAETAPFAEPEARHVFHFPEDLGAHEAFRLEWWYLTGHLFSGDRRFGFQATFFRQASPDGHMHLQLAHMAIVDASTGRYLFQERVNAKGRDADARADTLDVWQGPWSLRLTRSSEPWEMRLEGGIRADGALSLDLKQVKPLVLFGRDGLSRKGPAPGDASYYLSLPRLAASGRLRLDGRDFEVRGEAWMDHEISSRPLGAGLVGWDWAGIQLADGREIMLYRLRHRSGEADPASALTWVDRAGHTREEAFSWSVLSSWKSPVTGATYPATVEVTTLDPETGRNTILRLVPLVPDQELSGRLGRIPYWEGACRVEAPDGTSLGSAYLELTGYASDLVL